MFPELPGPPLLFTLRQEHQSVGWGAAGGRCSLLCLHLLPPLAGRPAPPEAKRGRKEGSWEVGELGGHVPLLGWLFASLGGSSRWQLEPAGAFG